MKSELHEKAIKDIAHKKKSGDSTVRVDRREFIKKAGLASGGVILAGLLGTVIGCGPTTTNSAESGYNPGTIAPEGSGSLNTNSEPSASSAAADCRFNNNGICSKTGQPCTDCIGDR